MIKKQNFSRKRQAILQALRSTKTHPTAEWIHKALKEDYPDLSLGTVYRNLSRFKEEGVISSMGVINGQERFDANTSSHSHFICNCCGAVLDIDQTFENPLAAQQVQQQYGVLVQLQKIVFYGTCQTCVAKH